LVIGKAFAEKVVDGFLRGKVGFSDEIEACLLADAEAPAPILENDGGAKGGFLGGGEPGCEKRQSHAVPPWDNANPRNASRGLEPGQRIITSPGLLRRSASAAHRSIADDRSGTGRPAVLRRRRVGRRVSLRS